MRKTILVTARRFAQGTVGPKHGRTLDCIGDYPELDTRPQCASNLVWRDRPELSWWIFLVCLCGLILVGVKTINEINQSESRRLAWVDFTSAAITACENIIDKARLVIIGYSERIGIVHTPDKPKIQKFRWNGHWEARSALPPMPRVLNLLMWEHEDDASTYGLLRKQWKGLISEWKKASEFRSCLLGSVGLTQSLLFWNWIVPMSRRCDRINVFDNLNLLRNGMSMISKVKFQRNANPVVSSIGNTGSECTHPNRYPRPRGQVELAPIEGERPPKNDQPADTYNTRDNSEPSEFSLLFDGLAPICLFGGAVLFIGGLWLSDCSLITEKCSEPAVSSWIAQC